MDFLENQILEKNIVVLDKVAKECSYLRNGQVIKTLPFINDKKYKTSTGSLIAPQRFHNLVDHNFINGTEKNQLSEAEYQIKRTDYINSADCTMILYAFTNKDTVIVTEESGYNNDGKAFKKIPENCKSIGITTMTLPDFLKQNGISLSIEVAAATLFE